MSTYASRAKKPSIFKTASGRKEAADFFRQIKAQGGSANTTGGFLVPDSVSDAFIQERDKYGTFRQYAQFVPMTSDRMTVPRRSAGMGATAFLNEAATITEATNMTFDAVGLTAKKIASFIRASTELEEDGIAAAERITSELAYQVAKYEDTVGFTADGSSTYYGITGVNQKILNLAGGSKSTAGHNTFATVDTTDLTTALSLLPSYAWNERTRWFIHPTGFSLLFARLAVTGGGYMDVGADGLPMFLGIPIVKVTALPSTSLSGKVMLLVGDLSLAAIMGATRDLKIDRSWQRWMDQDLIGYRATERFDIVVHSVGDGTTAGPVIALVGN
jgi:HK97 family phage major capsid protein